MNIFILPVPPVFYHLTLYAAKIKLSIADAPEAAQLYLSDPASVYMEGLLEYNKHLLVTITSVVIVVAWLLISTIQTHEVFRNSQKTPFFHSNVLEITWTLIPAVTLLLLAPSSFTLLYSLDEAISPKLSLKIIGHQWFWCYEIADFDFLLTCLSRDGTLKYSCYLLATETIFEKNYRGFLRLLETNKRVLLPASTHLRILVTSADVLHSWTVPSFGIKVDACPGRLNQVNIFLKRAGLFFGQCSEICGVNHGFMPIGLFVVPSTQFYVLLSRGFTNH